MSRRKKLPIDLALPDLSVHEILQEKIDAIHDYLKIYSIFCKHSSIIDTEKLPKDHASIEVTHIIVPGGQPSYIKSLLQEILAFFRSNITRILETSDGSLDDFHSMLNSGIEKCISSYKEFDISNSLTCDYTFTYRIAHKNSWIVRPLQSLLLSENHQATINSHFCMRRDFFGELSLILQTEQQRLAGLTIENISKNIWANPEAEMQVAALLYGLDSLYLDFKDGSNTRAIFINQFYGLFGLDAKGHSQRVQTLKRSKSGDTYLYRLADFIAKEIWTPRRPSKKGKVSDSIKD